MGSRRSDYDVTDTVQVSSVDAVVQAVQELFFRTYPGSSFAKVRQAFEDFWRLFNGELPGYRGCDTIYHDAQHTLDMTLAMARLIAGYELLLDERGSQGQSLGPSRASLGLIVSLFHDSGYIRKTHDEVHAGAEFTLKHVTRGAEFLESYLPTIGMGSSVHVARKLVHFTGYEMPLTEIDLDDPKLRKVGCLLGTADLIAQMADRCYLEKCRDRLYPEFVLGGVTAAENPYDGEPIHYESGQDLLKKTPEYFETVIKRRLEGDFDHAYKYVEPLFDGRNVYMDAIHKNLAFLDKVLETGKWRLLRRNPPCFTSDEDTVPRIRALAQNKLKKLG